MATGSAEALAVAMKDADCATKADIAAVRADVALVRTEVESEIASLRADVDLKLAVQDATTAGFQANFAAGLTIAAMRFMPHP